MVFSSLIFLCLFLPAALLVYNFSKNITYKNAVLVLFSLVFYAWGEPVWVILLIFSASLDYMNGLIIDRNYGTPKARAALACSLIINLGILAVFKYSPFIVENLNLLLPVKLPEPTFSLPIGISFYTFQTLSYTIDLYRGRTRVQRSLLSYMAYLSMFPQLVAGPIVRYSDIAAELRHRRVSGTDFAAGAKRFTAGLCKKVVLANNAGDVAQMLLSTSIPTTASSWLGIIMYTFQIYFDFSGYSDMAIGMGRMLGFHFMENFDYPYISKNITDFWRRWHISLSSFFRDYVYIPLGGNRFRPVRNIIIVWLLTGLWHGASWNFVLWGLYYFVFLAIEKLFLGKFLEKLPAVVGHAYALFIIVVGWVFFYFDDVSRLGQMLKLMFGFSGQAGVLPTDTVLLKNHLVFFLVAIIACIPVSKLVKALLIRFSRKGSVQESLAGAAGILYDVALLFFSTAALVGASYNPFLYFRF